MKGITEIDEQAALLLVRAYKAAYQSEGPRIRSEVWQQIAHQLNKQNTRNLTVTQWKKRVSNIKSLVKLKSDMERRGRPVNWTTIEREYLRLFPSLILDDDNSSLSDGAPNSIKNGFSLEDEQALVEYDLDMDETPATMVKTEAPKWNSEQLRQSLLEAHKHFMMTTAAAASTSNQANSDVSTISSTPTTTTEQSSSNSTIERSNPSLPASSTSNNENTGFQPQKLPLHQKSSSQAPLFDLRSIVAQMDSTQRKQSMLTCLRNFRQQIDLFTELLEQDLALSEQSF